MRQFAFALTAFVLLACGGVLAQSAEGRPQRVLIFSTGTRLAPGFLVADQPILSALRSLPPGRIEILAENLDIIGTPQSQARGMITDYLGAKYAQYPPDLAILFYVAHLEVTAESLQALFPKMPLIVAGFSEAPLRPGHFGPMVGGLAQRMDPRTTFELILRLHRGVRRVIVVGGTADVDRVLLERVRMAAREFEDRVDIDFWDNLKSDELRQVVPNMPPGTVIFYTQMFRDAAGLPSIPSEVARWIGHWASVPVYALYDTALGTGAVGGSLASIEEFAHRAAEIALAVLKGKPIADFPFEIRTRAVPTFDGRALERWGISERALPPGSVVRFKPPSPWVQYRWYVAGALLIIAAQGATIVALIVQRRRRQRAEREARQQRAELAHVGRVSLMGELAAALAHELSQPLTAIYANASAGLRAVQQGAHDPAELGEILDDVVKDQTRAAEVLRHMRRMVKKETDLEFAAVDLSAVIDEVVSLVRNDAALEHVEIAVDVEASLPRVLGDRVQLQQVLLNLLLNAVDAMKAVPRRARIVVLRARRDEGMIQVTVRDRGPGIAANDVERVFEPFYTTKGEGLGMGLSICRSIIQAHGGRLWAQNNADGGATFCFTLPARPAERAAAPSQARAPSPAHPY